MFKVSVAETSNAFNAEMDSQTDSHRLTFSLKSPSSLACLVDGLILPCPAGAPTIEVPSPLPKLMRRACVY